MNTPHEQYHDLMTDVLFDEASDAERRRLEAHLDACEPCADEFASLQATLRVADRRERPALPEAYWDSYRARLERRMRDDAAARRSSVGERLRRWWRSLPALLPQTGPQWAVQAVAMATVLLVGVWVGGAPTTPDDADAPSTSSHTTPLTETTTTPDVLGNLLLASETITSPRGSVRPSITGVEDVTYDVTAGTVEIRYNTVNDIVIRGTPDDPAIQRLLRAALLDERNPSSRLHAVKTMESAAMSPNDDLVRALTYLAREETDVHMRIRAVRALRALHQRAPVEGDTRSVLVGILLESDNDALRIEALQALTGENVADATAADTSAQEIPGFLYQIRNDTNVFVRTRAEQLIRRGQPDDADADDAAEIPLP